MISRFQPGRAVNQPQRVDEPGDVTLRVTNLQRMKYFYRHALGFELIGEFSNAALLEIASPTGGRAQSIGLFQRAAKSPGETRTDHRISFSISLKDCRSTQSKLERLGFRVEVKDSNRLWVQDPEGNRIELNDPLEPTLR